jgi:hypothetical protein
MALADCCLKVRLPKLVYLATPDIYEDIIQLQHYRSLHILDYLNACLKSDMTSRIQHV